MKFLLIVLCIFFCTPNLDVYLIISGARQPTAIDLIDHQEINSELNVVGKSQSFYLGKQLKLRHPFLSQNQIVVYSAQNNHILQTTEYFLRGWYQLSQDGSNKFTLNKHDLPPINLTYIPQEQQKLINQTFYRSKIVIPDRKLNYGGQCAQVNLSRQYNTLLQKIKLNEICQDFAMIYPEYCQDSGFNKVQKIMQIIDIKNCLKAKNPKIHINQQIMELAYALKNQILLSKFFDKQYQIASITNFLSILLYIFRTQNKHLFLSFTTELFILNFLGVLQGKQNFQKSFEKEINLPFGSNLHINMKQTVSILLNDKPIQLNDRFKAKNGEISILQFFTFLGMYATNYQMICNKSY